MDAKIHYCHPGYVPSGAKSFLVAFSEGSSLPSVKFNILDSENRVVYEGLAENLQRCEYTGETLFKGDFSAVKTPGRYQIALVDFDAKSHLFEVSDEWMNRELKANIKSFY